MNISPNTDGLIDEPTVQRLAEFKTWVDQIHSRDLCRSATVKVTSSSHRGRDNKYSPQMAIDGDFESYFATDDSIRSAVIEIALENVQEIDGFILQEYIPLGQRVNGYSLECRVNGNWEEVYSGNTIGYKRIILEGRASATGIDFPATDGVRLRIENALACPLISSISVIGSK
jgi:alpha-L-fucosidase